MNRVFLLPIALFCGIVAMLPVQSIGQSGRTTLGPCQDNAVSMRGEAEFYSCQCRARDTRTGNVWGTDVYSDDSNICRAALHAGAVDNRGGMIRIRLLPGLDKYEASDSNGVSSMRWETRWHGSYEFVDFRRGSRSAGARPRGPAEACPTNARSMRDGDILRCRCEAGEMRSGFVYGSDEYSHISHICRAARHAGVIDRNGGLVRFRAIPGQRNYEGSYRNGIRSSNWAYSGTSIRFWRFRE